jgi:hypothetical protein
MVVALNSGLENNKEEEEDLRAASSESSSVQLEIFMREVLL